MRGNLLTPPATTEKTRLGNINIGHQEPGARPGNTTGMDRVTGMGWDELVGEV